MIHCGAESTHFPHRLLKPMDKLRRRECSSPRQTQVTSGNDAGIDRLIAAIASAHHGVISAAQMQAAGIARSSIAHRERTGRLHRLTSGVYLVGHYHWTIEATWSAALLWAGGNAQLTNRSGGESQGWLTAYPSRVTVTAGPRAQPRTTLLWWPGRAPTEVILHRWTPRAAAVRAPSGLATLSYPELVLGIAAVGTPGQLRAAVRAAEYRGQVTDASLRAMLGRGRHGSEALRALLDRRPVGTTPMRTALEERALELFLAAGMPLPRTNVWLPSHEPVTQVDFSWDLIGLVAEADGPEHRLPAQQQRDRDYEQALSAHGLIVVRFDDEQIDDRPTTVIDAMGPWVKRAAAIYPPEAYPKR